jgi:hypothetical protein
MDVRAIVTDQISRTRIALGEPWVCPCARGYYCKLKTTGAGRSRDYVAGLSGNARDQQG